MSTTHRPLVAFYGDDFTGSTDAMEALASQGLEVLLFLRTPTDDESALARERYACVGIAGTSRSRGVAWMDDQLPEPLRQLRALAPFIAHYKVCSTFDSSPTVGNIGRAIEIGRSVFASRGATPLVVGAPALGRYTAFGHLFARAHDGNCHRIDRHPTMSRHPVTPMSESDLILHLARQTGLRGSAMHFVEQRLPDALERFGRAMASNEMLLLDVLDDASQQWVGERLWQLAQGQDEPLFCVGSSGVEYALAAHWRSVGGQGIGTPNWGSLQPERIAVVSGSCSPVTARQIDCAEADGFVCLRADATRLVLPDSAAQEIARLSAAALPALGEGRCVLVYTARGPQDAAIAVLDAFVREQALDAAQALSRIGEGLGVLLRDLIDRAGLRRVAVAGGDTSGHAVQVLGLSALRLRAPLTPGAPLCDGFRDVGRGAVVEIALKGGQMGSDRYFASVAAGRALS
jgi:3-oxoisoapionate kinase